MRRTLGSLAGADLYESESEGEVPLVLVGSAVFLLLRDASLDSRSGGPVL